MIQGVRAFREGNGRAQLSFPHLVALRAGRPLDLTRVERDTMLPAIIATHEGDLASLATVIATLRA